MVYLENFLLPIVAARGILAGFAQFEPNQQKLLSPVYLRYEVENGCNNFYFRAIGSIRRRLPFFKYTTTIIFNVK